MSNNVLYVGLDVHKNSIDVALAEAGGEIRHYGSIGGELKDLEKVIRKLHSKGSELHFAYEAGPCGYQIFRFLKEKNYPCLVAAPALIPRRPGDRIKCDRLDPGPALSGRRTHGGSGARRRRRGHAGSDASPGGCHQCRAPGQAAHCRLSAASRPSLSG